MPEGAERVIEPFLVAADEAARGSYSAVLYGSAARGDHFPETSNINLLLVLDDVGPPALRALGPAVTAWRKATPEPPLVISRAEWARATDVFPLEITDMLVAYKVLRGPDPLADVRVARHDLRRALEAELRGKLLRLRQGYTVLSSDPTALGALALQSAPTALVLFRALLALLDRPVSPPSDGAGTVRAAAAAVGFAPEALLDLVRHRGRREWSWETAAFEQYMEAIARTAIHVDHLQLGDD